MFESLSFTQPKSQTSSYKYCFLRYSLSSTNQFASCLGHTSSRRALKSVCTPILIAPNKRLLVFAPEDVPLPLLTLLPGLSQICSTQSILNIYPVQFYLHCMWQRLLTHYNLEFQMSSSCSFLSVSLFPNCHWGNSKRRGKNTDFLYR